MSVRKKPPRFDFSALSSSVSGRPSLLDLIPALSRPRLAPRIFPRPISVSLVGPASPPRTLCRNRPLAARGANPGHRPPSITQPLLSIHTGNAPFFGSRNLLLCGHVNSPSILPTGKWLYLLLGTNAPPAGEPTFASARKVLSRKLIESPNLCCL